jgi:hypothetical protein
MNAASQSPFRRGSSANPAEQRFPRFPASAWRRRVRQICGNRSLKVSEISRVRRREIGLPGEIVGRLGNRQRPRPESEAERDDRAYLEELRPLRPNGA